MSNVRTLRSSFAAGELAPEMQGRVDFDKYQSGLALCQNFCITPQGAVQNRAGTMYVSTTKTNGARLIPFSFNSSQTIAIELGAGYFRFHAAEGTILGVNTLNSEMLLNSTFATDLSNWVNLCSSGASISWMHSGPDFGNGLYYSVVSMTSSAGIAMLSQAITTVPGKTYDISLFGWNDIWLFADTVAPTAGMGLTGGSLLNMEFTAGAANALNGYGATFTATTTTTYIRIGCTGVNRRNAAVSVRLSNGSITPFNLSTSYTVGNLVHDAFGNIFICVQNTSSNEFYNTLYFAQINGATPAAYSITTSYAIGNAVSYGGVNYYCIAGNLGNFPPNPVYWITPTSPPYEIVNNYNAADLFNIHYVQSGDVVTLVHPNYAPMELSRYGNINWTFTGINFASSLSAPSAPTAAATYPHAGYPVNRKYLLTCTDQYGEEESLPSTATGNVSNDLTIAGNYNTISFTGAGGTNIGYYNVYCSLTGSFGFIGQIANASGTIAFVDNNITPDMTQTPPSIDNPTPLSSVGNYPGAVGYYEQRRFFGGTNNQPMSFWATQPGTSSNLDYSIPSQASDALRVTIQAARSSNIEHIVGEQDLVLLTSSDEWRVFTASGDALSPSTISIKKQQSNGSTNIVPILIQNQLIYNAAVTGHLRALIYDWQLSGYRSDDLCILAQHLFKNHSIVDMSYSRWAPYPTVWCVRDDGVLLGLTYEPGQQVAAWHQHTTVNGAFKSICCIQEGNFDVLYCIVERTINGVVTQYVEAMDTRAYGTILENANFVDSGITQVFASPVIAVSGLTWLESQTVSALLDGKAVTGLTVSSGAVTLPYAAFIVTIGLPITATLQTLPATIAGDASGGLGHIKNINKVWVRAVDYCGMTAGATGGNMITVPPLATDSSNNPIMAAGEIRSVVMPSYGNDGSLQIQQTLPLPLTICDIVMEVSIGG